MAIILPIELNLRNSQKEKFSNFLLCLTKFFDKETVKEKNPIIRYEKTSNTLLISSNNLLIK